MKLRDRVSHLAECGSGWMDVAVVKTRENCLAMRIDELRPRSLPFQDVSTDTKRDEFCPSHRDCINDGTLGIESHDSGVVQNEIGRFIVCQQESRSPGHEDCDCQEHAVHRTLRSGSA